MNVGGMSGASPDFSVMRAQMQERMNARFEKADGDQSGGLSLDEFSAAHEERNAKRAERGGSAGPAKSAEEIFANMDKDEDGQITKDEMQAAKPKRPKPPHGSFSSDMMSSLLSMQENTNSLLESFSKQQDALKSAR